MSDSNADMVLDDLTPLTRRYTDRQGKVVYILREASADAATAYRNDCLKATKVATNKDGGSQITSLEGLASADPRLLSACLFQVDNNGQIEMRKSGSGYVPVNVPLPVILSWPSRVVNDMVDWIKKNSLLGEYAETKKTPEELESEIAKLQEELDLTRNGQVQDTAKNALQATTGTSD